MNNKFRGKTEDGEWVCGYIVKCDCGINKHKCYISEKIESVHMASGFFKLGYFKEVIPETVGQFTGLCDKNGKEIYAGDIIEFYFFGEEKNLKETGYIHYSKRRAAFMIKVKSGEKLLLALNIPTSISILDPETNLEVIGNTTDNSELIK